jgi:hypothetical protein
MLLFPFGLYFSACLGILSVSILSTCCGHSLGTVLFPEQCSALQVSPSLIIYIYIYIHIYIYIERDRERTVVNIILVGTPEGRRPFGRRRRRWEDNIKMDIPDVGWGMDWIELA